VTTGGGALPLPTYCAQPATLRRANTAAITSESFFMEATPFMINKMLLRHTASSLKKLKK
jgi:hypothetical protein